MAQEPGAPTAVTPFCSARPTESSSNDSSLSLWMLIKSALCLGAMDRELMLSRALPRIGRRDTK